MPTSPTDRLRLEALEDRSLLSAEIDPPAPIVVAGTDANDIITLKRLVGDRVIVTVESFCDPEWTQPTGDPVRQYEVLAGNGTLTPEGDLPLDAGLSDGFPTTGTILVDGGAGRDRIVILDVRKGFYVSGSHRTDDSATSELFGIPVPWPGDERISDTPEAGASVAPVVAGHVPWLHDEQGARWALSHDFFTMEWGSMYRDAITEGDYMADGAVVGIRLAAVPDDPPAEFLPGDGEGAEDTTLAAENPDGYLDAVGLDLVGVAGDDWAATGPWSDGGTDGSPDEADLADLWVGWADDLPIDPWDAGAGNSGEGSDVWVVDGLDEWLTIDVTTDAA